MMNKKAVIVTVDTEGDNLWDWKQGERIETENSKFLKPFQNLCEKYGFFPVYLTNYEMVMSDAFVEFAKECVAKNTCEIGMHLHAWNSPPEYSFPNEQYTGNPYITEYPIEIIREKHRYLKNLIENRIGVSPVSYRAGRWATSPELFAVLSELGFWVDCSVTPGISHKAPGRTVSHANNYLKSPINSYKLRDGLLEVPMSTRCRHTIKGNSLYRRAVNIVRGEQLWLRPALQTTEQMIRLIRMIDRQPTDYFMFMIHSSELMPGGNPYCKTQEDINQLLCRLDNAFSFVSGLGVGMMLKDYYLNHKQ